MVVLIRIVQLLQIIIGRKMEVISTDPASPNQSLFVLFLVKQTSLWFAKQQTAHLFKTLYRKLLFKKQTLGKHLLLFRVLALLPFLLYFAADCTALKFFCKFSRCKKEFCPNGRNCFLQTTINNYT